MPTEDDAFLVRARQQDRLSAEPESFGLAMTELIASDPVPLSEATSAAAKQLLAKQAQAFVAAGECVVEPMAVPEIENG